MKILAIIFCLFFSINTFAQSVAAPHDSILSGKVVKQALQKDTSNSKVIIAGGGPAMASTDKIFKDIVIIKPITSLHYVIDRNVYEGNIDSINSKQIQEIHILTPSTFKSISCTPNDGVVIIVTKSYALQKKLSTISKKYKYYLISHDYSDKNILYIVNGEPIQRGSLAINNKLYQLLTQDIKSVKFYDKGMKEEGMIANPSLIITTKN